MGGAAHALKRIPRIKFPQRHPKPSASSSSQTQATSASADAPRPFFSRPPSTTPGGKASDQPKRTPLSQEEIEAILALVVLLGFLDMKRLIQTGIPGHLRMLESAEEAYCDQYRFPQLTNSSL